MSKETKLSSLNAAILQILEELEAISKKLKLAKETVTGYEKTLKDLNDKLNSLRHERKLVEDDQIVSPKNDILLTEEILKKLKEAERDTRKYPFSPSYPIAYPQQNSYICPTCNMVFEYGKSYGYVCGNVACPSAITCGVTSNDVKV